MTERAALIEGFLQTAGWAEASRKLLAGDASNRRYDRLRKADGARAILMDAPPERGEDVRPFRHVAAHLAGCGLSAPEIYHADNDNGLLLIEDLGDDLSEAFTAYPSEFSDRYLPARGTGTLSGSQRHTAPPR